MSKEEIPADQYALRLGGNHDHFLCLVVYVIRRDFDAYVFRITKSSLQSCGLFCFVSEEFVHRW